MSHSETIAVKKVLGRGRFDGWLEDAFKWSRTTAYKFMSVAEKFRGQSSTLCTIAPSALYLLASDSTPAEVREQSLQQVACLDPQCSGDLVERVERDIRPPARLDFIPLLARSHSRFVGGILLTHAELFAERLELVSIEHSPIVTVLLDIANCRCKDRRLQGWTYPTQ